MILSKELRNYDFFFYFAYNMWIGNKIHHLPKSIMNIKYKYALIKSIRL